MPHRAFSKPALLVAVCLFCACPLLRISLDFEIEGSPLFLFLEENPRRTSVRQETLRLRTCGETRAPLSFIYHRCLRLNDQRALARNSKIDSSINKVSAAMTKLV